MSHPRRLPCREPEPEVLDLFEQPDRIPVAVRRQGEFFVFFAHTILPLLEEQSTGKVVFRIEWSNTVCGACQLPTPYR